MNKLEKKVLETISNKKVNLTNNEEQLKKLEQAMKTYKSLLTKDGLNPEAITFKVLKML